MLRLLLLAASCQGRAVEVAIRAPWPTRAVSPLIETAEFLAAESRDAYWSFVEAIEDGFGDPSTAAKIQKSSEAPRYDAAAHEEMAAVALDAAEGRLDGLAHALLRMALAVRTYAPRLEAHRSLASAAPLCPDGDPEATRAVVFGPSGRHLACAPADVAHVVKKAAEKVCTSQCDEAPRLLGSETPRRDAASEVTIELIVDVTTANFKQWHAACDATEATYFLRYASKSAASTNRTHLQAFGANLDIKDLEYQNMDDAATSATPVASTTAFDEGGEVGGVYLATLAQRRPDLRTELGELRTQLQSETSSDLKVWKIRDLSLQATQAVADAADPLRTLKDLSQDFPRHAAGLSARRVREDLREAATTAHAYSMHSGLSGRALVFLGGTAHDVGSPTFSLHALLQGIREEALSLRTLAALDVLTTDAEEASRRRDLVLSIDAPQQQPPSTTRVDLLSGSKGAVTYANNLEKDEDYKEWPPSVQQLLYPSWQLTTVAKNLYTALLVLDGSFDEALNAVYVAHAMLRQGYPVRVAFVLGDASVSDAVEGDVFGDDAASVVDEARVIADFGEQLESMGTVVAAAAALAKLARGPRTAWAFLVELASSREYGEAPTLESVISAYGEAISSSDEEPQGEYETSKAKATKQLRMLLTKEAHIDAVAVLVDRQRRFVTSKGLDFSGYVALNGLILEGLDLQQNLMPSLGQEQQRLQQLVRRKLITDQTKSIYGRALLGGAASRDKATHLVERHSRILEVEKVEYHWEAVERWVAGAPAGNVSVVLAADLSSNEGVRSAYLVLKHAEEAQGAARVSIVHNPSAEEPRASRGRYLAGHCASAAALQQAYKTTETASTGAAFRGPCEPGATCLFANGRKANAPQSLGDLSVLASSEATRAAVLSEAFASDDRPRLLDAIAAARAYAGRRSLDPRSDVQGLVEAMLKEAPDVAQLVLTSAGDSNRPAATAIFDPLSEAAQRAAPVLLALRDVLGLRVRLVLAPDPELAEMPLQKYYRFALDADALTTPPRAKFSSLPKHQVLTLRVDTPEAWDAQMAFADADPDNLRCSDSCDEVTRIAYELKSLVVMGQCYDVVDSRPPNGLQIQLAGTQSDTLVMQNLGYFQLRAQPGAWKIKLAKDTRSEALFETVQVEAVGFSRSWGGPSFDSAAAASDGVDIVVADFEATSHQLRVRKRPGKESEELLGDDDSSKSWFFKKKKKKKTKALDTIHVFSLATGSLYERMLKIMMLSVRKRTSGPIKFWLFENYLTPHFKEGAQALGEAKGFDVAYVTYKWPEWLRTQTVKQRIIWGYKILFLDVLFPLDVAKVIYVDADQVVRGNLRELWDLDLEGHAYGYTPFCDSRKETLGYQFWRSGYWKDHLRGKPYHISALYVVDLDVFRRRGVGDQLRMVYDQLSRDPGSLSNLDQDLPNYAQPQIPIFSLPQDWLWCESWCSDGSKATAKTIDLCNHPATKENKLSMAQRIVDGPLFPESWVELDGEVKAAEGAAGV